MTSSESTRPPIEPAIDEASTEDADERHFFEAGDRGTYPGGPASVPPAEPITRPTASVRSPPVTAAVIERREKFRQVVGGAMVGCGVFAVLAVLTSPRSLLGETRTDDFGDSSKGADAPSAQPETRIEERHPSQASAVDRGSRAAVESPPSATPKSDGQPSKRPASAQGSADKSTRQVEALGSTEPATAADTSAKLSDPSAQRAPDDPGIHSQSNTGTPTDRVAAPAEAEDPGEVIEANFAADARPFRTVRSTANRPRSGAQPGRARIAASESSRPSQSRDRSSSPATKQPLSASPSRERRKPAQASVAGRKEPKTPNKTPSSGEKPPSASFPVD